MIIESFEPIIDESCTTLILGTMPGKDSLAKNQYYSNGDNIFWDIMPRILSPHLSEYEIDKLSYKDKTDLILSAGIGLWDVLKYCERKGNLDRNIKNEIKNDFESFFKQHPQIKKIIFNGQKAEKFFEDFFKGLNQKHTFITSTLPSTSSSRTLNAFKKLKIWRQEIQSNNA